MDKDWTGNSKSTFANLGASNHSANEREARTEEQANFSLLKPESHEATQEMVSFICNKCGIKHPAICDKCRVKTITKIEVQDK